MKKLINNVRIALSGTDFILLLLCLVTSAYGCVMVYSATKTRIAEDAVISRDARTMILAVGIGIILAIIISFIDYNIIIKFAPAIAFVCLGLMAATLLFGVGPAERQDAKTWLAIGSQFYFQSSELLKIGFIITFGIHLELVSDKLKEFRHILLLCIHAAIPIGLVVISGDMGSALVFACIFATMMFCGLVGIRYFIIGAAAVVAAIPVVWTYIFSDIQKERFLALIYPDLYTDIIYQQQLGMQAIGSGGLTGQGLFKGALTQATIGVPERENDMIFSCIGEELGFIGCIAALLLIILIALRINRTAGKARETSTGLMCYGLSAMIISQTLINIGMCLRLLPVIGITLPFFSAGGSSNLCVYIGIGLIMSIYRYDKDTKNDAFNFNYLNYSISMQ